MSRKLAGVTTAMIASALLLGGCGLLPGSGETSAPPAAAESSTKAEIPAEPPAEEPKPEEPKAEEPKVEEPQSEEPEPEDSPTDEGIAGGGEEGTPAVQAESCDWDAPAVAGDSSGIPSSPGDSLETAIIGAWQHTHFDKGNGFETVGAGTDIRYVFPSTTRILYCQDVDGATSQAQNAADITLDGTSIVMPSPHKGFEVTAWSADTMTWTNNLDGSTYLLKRR